MNHPTVLDVVRTLCSKKGMKLLTKSEYFIQPQKKEKNTPQSEDLPRFESNSKIPPSIVGITDNASKANLYLKTIIEGRALLPENDFELDSVGCIQFWNVPVILNGAVMMETIPVSMKESDYDDLVGMFGDKIIKEVSNERKDDIEVVVDLKGLPIVHELGLLDIQKFVSHVRELNEQRGILKGLGHFTPTHQKTDSKFLEEYGTEATNWLNSIGVRENGVRQNTLQKNTPPGEEFVYKIKGLSNLPPTKKVFEKIEKEQPFTVGEALVNVGLEIGDSHSLEEIYGIITSHEKNVSDIRAELIDTMFSVLVSREWFEGLDSGTHEIKFNILGEEFIKPMTVYLAKEEVK